MLITAVLKVLNPCVTNRHT